MIKAIIFDFFGVLAVRDTGSFRQTHFPDDAQKIAQAAKLEDEMRLGKIGYDDFIDGLAKLGGVSRKTVLSFTEDYQPNKQLVEYISSRLKPKYKIGIISNAGGDWVDELLGDDTKLFDDIILSYKVGAIKPQPQIYRLSTHNLGIEGPEAVFIDDVLTYCQGAEAVGINTIWYQTFEQFKAELEKTLSIKSTDN